MTGNIRNILKVNMADLCFICNKLLSEGDSVTFVRGIKTLKEAIIERNKHKLPKYFDFCERSY